MLHFSQLDDFELLTLLRTGEEDAFRFIYDRYWDKLYIIARNRLNDSLEAEEIVQDIFCNFWRKRATIELTKGFDNYFSVAVKFEVINRLAKRARTALNHKEYTATHSDADNSFLHLLDYKEVKQQLTTLIGDLPEKCRIVFKLRHEAGYSLRQIAEELNISEKTVEAHLTKARKTLRGALYIFYIIYLSR
jgi:RNA polymerase sigma-70 factor (ECF subfamily)